MPPNDFSVRQYTPPPGRQEGAAALRLSSKCERFNVETMELNDLAVTSALMSRLKMPVHNRTEGDHSLEPRHRTPDGKYLPERETAAAAGPGSEHGLGCASRSHDAYEVFPSRGRSRVGIHHSVITVRWRQTEPFVAFVVRDEADGGSLDVLTTSYSCVFTRIESNRLSENTQLINSRFTCKIYI